MRTVIYDYIQALKLKHFTLTPHLPWEDNGAPLYHHNKKHIYVDTPQTEQKPVMNGLDQSGAVDETITVSVYFVNDAKILPTGYDDCVEAIKGARLATGSEGFIDRIVRVTSTFQADAMITKFEFSFRRLLTN